MISNDYSECFEGDSEPNGVTKPYQFEPTRKTKIKTNNTEEVVQKVSPKDSCSCEKCDAIGILPSNGGACCHRSCRIRRKMDSIKCITESPDFNVMCLNEEILRVNFKRILAIRKKRRKSSREVFDNKARRWTAYSQFIFWIYDGPLGLSVHKILPNCVYKVIRQTFPSYDKLYADFNPGDNDDIFID